MKRLLRAINGNLLDYLVFLAVMTYLLIGCGGLALADGEEAAPVVADVGWKTLAIVAFLAAPVAALVTEAGKKALQKVKGDCPGDPFWWQWGLRLLSVAVGAGVGLLLLCDAWGAVAGAGGGVLSSALVYALRRMIKGLAVPPAGGNAD